MRAILLITLTLISVTGFTQIKKDSSANALYLRSIQLHDTAKLPDYSKLFSPKLIDSNYIRIYHTKEHTNAGFPAAFYIDSVRVNSLWYIDPKDILDVKDVGGIDSANKINGKVYITLKKHSYHFITIEEITKRANLDSKTQPIIYFVDDKLITDTANLKFEITYIRDVEVTEGSQIKSFKGLLSNVTVININTGATPIYIRGNSTPASFKQ